MSTLAYLGIGSNLGDRLAALRRVVESLDAVGARVAIDGVPALRVRRCSSVYASVAIAEDGRESAADPPFLNAVLEVEVTLSAEQLWALSTGIEVALGRRSGPRHAPRVVDIDLLLFGEATIDRPELVVPHPRMFTRGFVMAPLHELLPERWPPWSGSGVQRVVDVSLR